MTRVNKLGTTCCITQKVFVGANWIAATVLENGRFQFECAYHKSIVLEVMVDFRICDLGRLVFRFGPSLFLMYIYIYMS